MKTDLPSDEQRRGDGTITEQKEEPANQKAEPTGESSSSSDATQEKESENPPPPPARKFTLPQNLAWIPANFTWSRLKPVIRCSLSAWVSLVFLLIRPLSLSLGQANFLLLISCFLSPPQGPFVSVLEREVYIVFFATLAWAWSCLGLKLASLARSEIITTPNPAVLFTGGYLEAGPTAIIAVFLFIGSAVLLYLKATHPPGPLLFATIFGCIAIDVTLLTAVLFPYPYYAIGKAVVLPIALHSGIALFFSATVFPSTVSSFYISKCHGVLLPMRSALQEHRRLLQVSTDSPALSAAKASGLTAASEAGLVPVASALYLLKRDIVWCRFSPGDFARIHGYARKLVVRATGMASYFMAIDPTRERFITTAATPDPATPGTSRPASIHREVTETDATESPSRTTFEHSLTIDSSVTNAPSENVPDSIQTGSVRTARRRKGRARFSEPKTSSTHGHIHHRPFHRHQHPVSHGSLLPVLAGRHPSQPAVGIYESMRYADLEEKFSHPAAASNTEKFHSLLKDCCDDMLAVTDEVLDAIDGWLNVVTNKSRFKFWRSKAECQRLTKERLDGYVQLKEKMDKVLEEFEKEKRHVVVEPYRASFNAKGGDASDPPANRHLFHCYVYQYHLWQFVKALSELFGEVIKLETERKGFKLWLPEMPWRKLLAREGLDTTEDLENDDDEDPDVIQGMQREWREDLGHAKRRDPDALPPKNAFEWIMNALYRGCVELVQGNSLYAIKAGVLTIVLSIPTFVPSSAKFSWDNKLVWGVIMGQLTLVRFRGDTSAGLVSRLLGTLFGVFVGAGLWYASTGLGRGNVYGLAAVCGALFPFMMFGRLYWPGSPMTNILFFVTAMLVIGYSWYNTHPASLASFPHWGIDLAIRRLILVAVGVAVAFIFSFLPPTTTLRQYQRTSLATATGELGAIYCSIVSFVNTGVHTEQDVQEIVQSLIAIRAKLKRSLVLKQNIIFEFSLRGRWPAERYQKILDIQLKIAYHLSYLMSVVVQFEPAWSRAFLRRCRFLDSEFQGEMLAVISLISTALRSGTPIPQITPCPLLDRFLRYNHGLDVVREAEDELVLPGTDELLEDEQYMYYCVGICTAYSIVNNLDKLMVATKELVGEQYHIHGIGIVQRGGYEPPTPSSIYPPASKEV